ncbi:MAG: DUF2318 domain-containing protein [Desulfuromonadales bacterium]|nr:DUF2318 domain-containing protein [Desulfuromonadales bacterium]
MSQDREQKKNQFVTPEKQHNKRLIPVIAALIVVSAVAGWLVLGQGQEGSDSYTKLASSHDEIRIDLDQVSDGQAHYFSHQVGGEAVSFFIVKSVDGVMRAAFDACDVCYREKKGYRQEGMFMVCNNCDQRFRTDLVNEVKGGCNPAPLERRVEGNEIVIRTADIAKGGWYFQSPDKS